MNDLINLFYLSEKYTFSQNITYKPYYDYLKELESSNMIDDEIKFYIENHKIKTLAYKTLCYNNAWIYYSNNLYKDFLLFLLIREYTNYKLCLTQPTLNIILNYNKNTIDTSILEKIDNIAKANYIKKRIIINENIFFDKKSINNFIDNEYEIVFKTSSTYNIHSEYTVLLLIDDNNVTHLNDMLYYYRNNIGTKKIELELQKNSSVETNNIYRYFVNKQLILENTNNCVITNNDLLPCQHLLLSNNNIINLTNRNITTKSYLINKNQNIESIIESLEKDSLKSIYIKKECINCSYNILCALGLSHKNCLYKI